MSADLNRIHDRIDKTNGEVADLKTESALMMQAQKNCFRALERLSASVDAALHKTPCNDLINLRKCFESHYDDHKKTVEIERTNKRDWKMLAMGLLGKVLWLAGAAIAGGAFIWIREALNVARP